MGLKLEEIQLNDLGQVGEVIVTKDDTLLMKGRGDAGAVEQRVAQIKEEIENTNSDYEREKFQERLAKLVGGVAVIKVLLGCNIFNNPTFLNFPFKNLFIKQFNRHYFMKCFVLV